MKNRLAIAGLLVLLVLAFLGKSAVMAVSVLGMGGAFWLFRTSPLPKKLVAVAVGALVAGLLAEVVHTVYHMMEAVPSGNDSGGFFVSATLVGLINAMAFGALLLLLEWFGRPAKA